MTEQELKQWAADQRLRFPSGSLPGDRARAVHTLFTERDYWKEQVQPDVGHHVLQAVLDAIKGTLDTNTQIADHPNVKFAQAIRHQLVAEREALKAQLREAKKWIGALEDTITPEIAQEASARFHRREDEPIE